MQDQYNLLNREEEREMLPLCADQGIGVIPGARSPVAGSPVTGRSPSVRTDEFGADLYHSGRATERSSTQVAAIAEARGVPVRAGGAGLGARAAAVTAPIVGATKPHHLDDAVAAVGVTLTDDEVAPRGALHRAPGRGLR